MSNLQLTGASFVMIVGGSGESSLSILEDGCLINLTTELFKALTGNMRSASPLQLREKVAQAGPFACLPQLEEDAMITINWLEEAVPMHPASAHVSRDFLFSIIF